MRILTLNSCPHHVIPALKGGWFELHSPAPSCCVICAIFIAVYQSRSTRTKIAYLEMGLETRANGCAPHAWDISTGLTRL